MQNPRMEKLYTLLTQKITKRLYQLHDRVDQLGTRQIEFQISILVAGYLLTMLNPLLGIGALTILLYGYRRKWQEQVSDFVASNGILLSILLPMAGFLALAATIDPTARDDLLRDLIVGQYYQYDYRKLYPISALPSFDLWWGFDHSLNWMQRFVSRTVVMWLLQVGILIGLSAIIARSVLLTLDGRADKAYWAGIAVSVALYLCVGRIALARPEIILSVWAISAVLVRRGTHVFVWTLVGVLLATAYWLAFLYFIAALLFSSPFKQKLISLCVLVIAHAAFWLLMFGEQYTQALLWLPQVLHNQITVIGENVGMEVLLGNPAVLGLLGLVAIGLFTQRSRHLLWMTTVLCFFVLSNQVRYIGIIAPLLILLCIALWKDRLPHLTTIGRIAAIGLCFVTQLQAASTLPPRKDAPHFSLPSNARVITAFGQATYTVPFDNPGIQIEPSYAFGAAPKDLQQLSMDIGGHGATPDCATVRKYRFTHVVEQTMTSIPSCFELIEVNKKWRLWHVR